MLLCSGAVQQLEHVRDNEKEDSSRNFGSVSVVGGWFGFDSQLLRIEPVPATSSGDYTPHRCLAGPKRNGHCTDKSPDCIGKRNREKKRDSSREQLK